MPDGENTLGKCCPGMSYGAAVQVQCERINNMVPPTNGREKSPSVHKGAQKELKSYLRCATKLPKRREERLTLWMTK